MIVARTRETTKFPAAMSRALRRQRVVRQGLEPEGRQPRPDRGELHRVDVGLRPRLDQDRVDRRAIVILAPLFDDDVAGAGAAARQGSAANVSSQRAWPGEALGRRASGGSSRARRSRVPTAFRALLVVGDRAGGSGLSSLAVGVLGVVEEGEEAEVLLLGERVVLVVVALGAGDGRAHPDGHRRVDAVDDGDVAELLVVGPALVVGHRVAVEGGRDELLVGRVRAAGRRRSARW